MDVGVGVSSSGYCCTSSSTVGVAVGVAVSVGVTVGVAVSVGVAVGVGVGRSGARTWNVWVTLNENPLVAKSVTDSVYVPAGQLASITPGVVI